MKHLQHSSIDFNEVLKKSHHPESGAVVIMSGEVRDNNKGRQVTHLEYEAYETMADKMIGQILEEAKNKFKLNTAICIHRLGYLEVSECAVVVLTGAGHRKEAYDANRYIIARVKAEVPIWKHEFFSDGTSEWGQNNECQTNTDEHEHRYEKVE